MLSATALQEHTARIKQVSLNEHRHPHLPFSSTLPNYFPLNRTWKEVNHCTEGYCIPPAHPSSATSMQQNILHVVLLPYTRPEINKLRQKITIKLLTGKDTFGDALLVSQLASHLQTAFSSPRRADPVGIQVMWQRQLLGKE